MPNWIEHLTAAERRQLEEIEQRRNALRRERHTIYERAKKRRQRALDTPR